ncbi:NodT family efflux transporter outer membrane factor (OMF) lipoprotein [Mycetohabitans endofungorum]|uniref:NodT family efflux transporter outer membrane factor (OMF) lipoprotein n=1 Tax=Mycetohabitans endofungorum TaxID=417203 RepID=A0A2P5KAK0_9BURK|nr:NodT family efflux transporter outer membrane factor (OMF) lipoprotein [Mycetohabitans endofungorum]
MIVVIVFLQTWRASIIPLIAVPVSIVGTFSLLLAFGFSINALSLFGMVLAIGIVVDDAIVVVENVERNIASGLSAKEATYLAMREVSGPIIAIALMLVAVFVPLAFMSGLTGQFYKQFAMTIAISTVISAFNSLTLSPALSVLLLKARTVALREQALQLVQHRFDEGDISELDVARATSELATARSDAITLAQLRAVSEHSLAILLGKPPAQISLAPRPLEPVTVQIPAGLPSALLERRPDIAAAERAMAAANARIGIAKAAFFPSLTLTGAGGFESASLGDLFRWTSRTFLLGPMVGTALTMPLFDGGARSANLANARAKYEEDVVNYRQQVLVAFQEVEDNLANLRILTDQIQAQNDAVQASGRVAQLSRAQYREGSVNYLDVIDSERTVLQSQRAAVQLTGAQAVYTVNLIRALGGGWDAPTSPTQPASPLAAR